MTYQILKDGVAIKTISAKGMESIYNQFNSYSRLRKATPESRSGAVGVMVWILPNGKVLSLSAV